MRFLSWVRSDSNQTTDVKVTLELESLEKGEEASGAAQRW